MTSSIVAIAGLSALSAAALVSACRAAIGESAVRASALGVVAGIERGWQDARRHLTTIVWEGRIDHRLGERRALNVALLVAGVFGYSLLGLFGAVFALALTPPVWRSVLVARRRHYANRVDGGCDEFAMALASALSAGNSVRGALMVSSGAVESPLKSEVEKLCVDLTLGDSVADAMAAIRDRTRSPRIEAISGAIALHQDSGGDLVELMRELASAFRARDRAERDARAATTQARYTAGIVAAIPIVMGVCCELIKPGSVSGAAAYLPTAMMLALAALVMLIGVTACFRVGRV